MKGDQETGTIEQFGNQVQAVSGQYSAKMSGTFEVFICQVRHFHVTFFT